MHWRPNTVHSHISCNQRQRDTLHSLWTHLPNSYETILQPHRTGSISKHYVPPRVTPGRSLKKTAHSHPDGPISLQEVMPNYVLQLCTTKHSAHRSNAIRLSIKLIFFSTPVEFLFNTIFVHDVAFANLWERPHAVCDQCFGNSSLRYNITFLLHVKKQGSYYTICEIRLTVLALQ